MTEKNQHPNSRVLITGASGGIGLEFAKLFARDHHDLIVVARSLDKLSNLASELKDQYGIQVHVLAKDLNHPKASEEIYQETQKLGFQVEILINNAGLGSYGYFWENDLERELNMLQVNMVALTHLSHLFLREMVAGGSGKILNVASTAAFQPDPLMAVYYATKAYVLSFSEALANELKGTGVTVSCLCPGPTETGFHADAEMEIPKLLKTMQVMDAPSVASAGYEGLMKGKTLITPGLANKITAQSHRFYPRAWVTRIVRMVQDKRKS